MEQLYSLDLIHSSPNSLAMSMDQLTIDEVADLIEEHTEDGYHFEVHLSV